MPTGSPRQQPARTSGAVRLLIPSMGLRASVVPVGVVDQVLSPPRESWIVGWWAAGAHPGSSHGSVVLTGHTLATGDGVFGGLGRLRDGTRVTVLTKNSVVHYTVSRAWTMGRPAYAVWAPTLTPSGGAARLVLVTCAGWDGSRFQSVSVAVARPFNGSVYTARPRRDRE